MLPNQHPSCVSVTRAIAVQSSIPRRPGFLILPMAVIIVLALCRCLPAQNLILNGDFEIGPHDVDSPITSWSVTGAARTALEGATTGDYSAAMSIGGDFQGDVLSQTFSTNPGQAYLVQFDSGIFGTRTGDPLQLEVQVLGNTPLLDRVVTPSDAETFNVGAVAFQHYTFVFVADSSSTTLQFTDIGLGNAAADTEIDSVSVTAAAIDAPTSLPLVNGDFEAGPFNINGSVSGWMVLGAGHVAAMTEGATSGSHCAALSPGGTSQDDILAQRFFTTAGQQYSVDFDAAIYGDTNSTLSLRTRVLSAQTVLDQTIIPPYFDSFDPAAIQFQHYHFVFTAGSAISTLEFSDMGLGNDNADVVLDSVSVAPVPPPPSFAAWQGGHFTPDQLNNPTISGWSADPDLDGIANGLEFFFNTDPLAGITVSDSPSLPRIAIETFSGSRYLTYTYHRLIGWTGNPEVVGVADLIGTWDVTGVQIEQVNVTPSGDGVTEIVKVRLKTPIDQGPVLKKFFRLSLTQ